MTVRQQKTRLWYELPVDRNRRVMASLKPGDSGSLSSWCDSSLYAVRRDQTSPVPCAERTWGLRVTRASALAWEYRSGQEWHAAITRALPTSCAFFAADAASDLPRGWQQPESLVCSEPATTAASGSPTSHDEHLLTASSSLSFQRELWWYTRLDIDRLRAPYGHLMMAARCSYDASTIAYIARAPWGDRANIVRCRTVIVGIVRASCDFLESQNISKSYGDRTATVRKSWRRPYDAACDWFTGYDAYGES